VNGCSTKAPHILEVIWRSYPSGLAYDLIQMGHLLKVRVSLVVLVSFIHAEASSMTDYFAIPLGDYFAFEAKLVAACKDLGHHLKRLDFYMELPKSLYIQDHPYV